MNIEFSIGNNENHLIKFYFNQIVGDLSITVDDEKIISDFRMFSLKLTKNYEFEVGNEEKHFVKISKTRKLIFAGFRKQKYIVFVDGQILIEKEGF